MFSFFRSKSSICLGTAFFLMGFLFGNWATLIPFIKQSYSLDDGVLGLILLCLPLGAMTFNPVAAKLISKYGHQKVTAFGMVFISITYLLPFSINTFALLPLALMIVGFSMTILNISANISATNLELHENVSIMATCHGMFSIGLMSGSLMRSLTLLVNINEVIHMLVICGISLILTAITRKTILCMPDQKRTESKIAKKSAFALPKGDLLIIIIISVCINMTEGSMTDWASVYMKEIVITNPYFVGWGLFGYSFFMAIGRLFGDGIIPVYGRNNILIYGSILAFIGLSIVIFLPFTFSSIIGFGFIGLGVSCGSPILYASASRYPDIPDGGGLALMNSFAMGGFLLGPVVIGFISNATSLQVAFGFVALISLIWMTLSKRVSLY
ncbi:MAG: MFS transporter [Saprospiraceae bacterium]